MTVICIFLDAERHIEEAIESVLAQDWDDYELLLVDDGSKDGSTRIAKAYAVREPDRIRYLDHPNHANLGMSAARNLGLREARGEYVAFIDSDDRWRPFKLREQVAFLDRDLSVDAVTGSVNYWASHAGGNDKIIKTGRLRNRSLSPPEALLQLYPLGRATAPSMSDLLFRKKKLLESGGAENAFRGAYEDQALLAKFYLRSTLHVTESVWSDYRLHPGSCSAAVQRNGSYHVTRYAFLEWLERHLAQSEYRRDSRVNRKLKKALHPYRRLSFRERLAKTRAGSTIRRGRAVLRALKPVIAPGPAILMYHRIATGTFDPWQLAVSPANFEDQLQWIAKNRTVLPLEEFADRQRRDQLPRDAIALTFDDGYACNARIAAPLLERFDVPATFFLSPDLTASGREFWWDELEYLVLTSEEPTVRLDEHEIALGETNPDDPIWGPASPPRTARQLAYRKLWSILYAKPSSELPRVISELREQVGAASAPRESHRPMSADEARAVRSNLIQFGSHSHSHASLPALDTDARRFEISRSVESCTTITGQRPTCFAYPYGNSNVETEELVEAAGFACACVANGGFVRKRSKTFALPRMLVGDWNSAELARKLGRP